MSPIKTRIKNLSDEPLTLYWATSYGIPIQANGEIIVDGEPWSAKEKKKREDVIAAVSTGTFELSLLITSTNGEIVEVPYCPQFAADAPLPPPVVAAPAVPPVEEKKEEKQEEPIKIEDKFNVIATTDESRETLSKLGARPADEIEREPVPALEFEKKEEPTEEEAQAEEAPAEEAKPAKKSRSKK